MRYITLILITTLLTACASTDAIKVVERDRLIPVELDTRLFSRCEIPSPPDRVHYMSVDISDRETILTRYSIVLMESLKLCNLQIETIKKAHDAAIERIKKGAA